MKLTKAVRRRITADWSAQFQELGVYRPLHLLRRVGPMLQGIALDGRNVDDSYMPTVHVHSLLREFGMVTMSMDHRLLSDTNGVFDTVSVARHEQRYAEAAGRLTRQSPLPLTGTLRLSQVISAYRAFAERPGVHYDAHLLYEDMAAYCGWAGDADQAQRLVAEGYQKLGQWPPDVLGDVVDRSEWSGRLSSLVSDREKLHAIMRGEIKALEVESVPVSAMLLP